VGGNLGRESPAHLFLIPAGRRVAALVAAAACMEDKQITCKDCGSEFSFTARAQAYFVEQGFPIAAAVRCTWCKEAKRQKHAAKNGDAARNGGKQGKESADTGEVVASGSSKAKKKRKKADEAQEHSTWWDAMVERNKKSKTRCFNCGKKGHSSDGCPKEKGSVTGCFRCGSQEHRSRDCPTATAEADAAKARCYNCGAVGHQASDCTMATGNLACYLCGKEGHQARYCRSVERAAPTVDEAKVKALVAQRAERRAAGDYAGADEIRAELLGMGVRLQDVSNSWSAGPKRNRPMRECFAFQKGECHRGDRCHFEHAMKGVKA
jgi:hypothetical protein